MEELPDNNHAAASNGGAVPVADAAQSEVGEIFILFCRNEHSSVLIEIREADFIITSYSDRNPTEILLLNRQNSLIKLSITVATSRYTIVTMRIATF